MKGVDVHITDDYINGTYRSCSQVIYIQILKFIGLFHRKSIFEQNCPFPCDKVTIPSTGMLALDLMCGSWGAARCSAKRWFEFMGTPDPFYVPFEIKYVTDTNTTFTLHNPEIIPCNQSVDVSSTFNCLLLQNFNCLFVDPFWNSRQIHYHVLAPIVSNLVQNRHQCLNH